VSEAPEEKIRVYARIAPRLRASPPRFTIPQNLQTERDLRVGLEWSGGNPGKILDVKTSDTQTSVRLEENNGRQIVVLRVPADYKPPTRGAAFVTVMTGDAEAPSLRIPIWVARASQPTRRSPFEMKPPATGRTQEPASPAERPPKEQEP
jgi:hypothetical protein